MIGTVAAITVGLGIVAVVVAIEMGRESRARRADRCLSCGEPIDTDTGFCSRCWSGQPLNLGGPDGDRPRSEKADTKTPTPTPRAAPPQRRRVGKRARAPMTVGGSRGCA